MGQVLGGSATTTEAIRPAMQRIEESERTLARRHGVRPTRRRMMRGIMPKPSHPLPVAM